MNAKTIALAVVFGMVGAYIMGIISHKFGPLPGLKS